MSGNNPKVTIPDHFIMTCSRLLPIIFEVPRGISRFYLELDNLLVISSGSKNPEQSSSSSLKYLNIPVLNPMFALFQYFSFLVSKKIKKLSIAKIFLTRKNFLQSISGTFFSKYSDFGWALFSTASKFITWIPILIYRSGWKSCRRVEVSTSRKIHYRMIPNDPF